MTDKAIIEAAARQALLEAYGYPMAPEHTDRISHAVLATVTPLIEANALEEAAQRIETDGQRTVVRGLDAAGIPRAMKRLQDVSRGKGADEVIVVVVQAVAGGDAVLRRCEPEGGTSKNGGARAPHSPPSRPTRSGGVIAAFTRRARSSCSARSSFGV